MSDSNPDSEHESNTSSAGWRTALFWLLTLGAGTWLAQSWLDAREASYLPRLTQNDLGQQTLTLKADRYGHYEFEGEVNGEAVRFLLDTGATGISLPASVADRLNLESGRALPIMTANGTAQAYVTQLTTLSIGPFIQRDVRAHIAPSMGGNTALLGMDFLRHFELHQRDGYMMLSLP